MHFLRLEVTWRSRRMLGPGKKGTYTDTVWQVCGWLQVSADQPGICGWDLVSSTLPNPSHTPLIVVKTPPCYMYYFMWDRSKPDALRISCWLTSQWNTDPKDMTWCNSLGSTSVKSSTISHRDHSCWRVDSFCFRQMTFVQNQTNTKPKC